MYSLALLKVDRNSSTSDVPLLLLLEGWEGLLEGWEGLEVSAEVVRRLM